MKIQDTVIALWYISCHIATNIVFKIAKNKSCLMSIYFFLYIKDTMCH